MFPRFPHGFSWIFGSKLGATWYYHSTPIIRWLPTSPGPPPPRVPLRLPLWLPAWSPRPGRGSESSGRPKQSEENIEEFNGHCHFCMFFLIGFYWYRIFSGRMKHGHWKCGSQMIKSIADVSEQGISGQSTQG